MALFEIAIRREDILDLLTEQPGDFEGQRQTGIVLAGLDCVDGSAGNLEPFRFALSRVFYKKWFLRL